MVSASDIHVTGVVPEQTVDESGRVVDNVRVFYTIGEFGPYSIVLSKLEVTANRVLMDVRADAQRYIDILNLQFS